jgi:hypothetical protein
MNEIKYFNFFLPSKIDDVAGDVRLMPVVTRLYLNLIHTMSAFSPSRPTALQQQTTTSSPQPHHHQ